MNTDERTFREYLNDFMNEAHVDKNIKKIQLYFEGVWLDIVNNNNNFIHCAHPIDGNNEIIIDTVNLNFIEFRKIYK